MEESGEVLHGNEKGIKWFFGKPYKWIRVNGQLRLVRATEEDIKASGLSVVR